MLNISPSLEDYLESIYRISGLNGARITDIAQQTGFSKPSVNRAVKTLVSQGLAEHEPYGRIILTSSGADIAKSINNRHIVIRRFLKEQLGVADDIAELEACKMEHTISEDTMQKLVAYISGIIG